MNIPTGPLIDDDPTSRREMTLFITSVAPTSHSEWRESSTELRLLSNAES